MGSSRDAQFIGMVRTDNVSEIGSAGVLSVEAAIDPGFVAEFAPAHERAGFDRVLIGRRSTGPDSWAVAGHAAAHTEGRRASKRASDRNSSLVHA